jgi:hypothetical protein
MLFSIINNTAIIILNKMTEKKISYVTKNEIKEFPEIKIGDKVKLTRLSYLMKDNVKKLYESEGVVRNTRYNDILVFFDNFDSTKRATVWIKDKYLTKI